MSQISGTPTDRPEDGPHAAANDTLIHACHQASRWLREFLADWSEDWAQRLPGDEGDEALP